nr:hypothetical protein [uncultured Mucilaginibacter sp.]
MFRKLHSNRDPRDTLYSEFKKEFRMYLERFNQMAKKIMLKYPRFLFGAMVLLLIASATLAILLHHKPMARKPDKSKQETKVFNTELDRITAAGEALRQTIRLRRHVDSISAKKALTKTDSLGLIQALDSLQHIQMALPH